MTNEEKWNILCGAMQQRYPVLASVWTQASERFGSRWVLECVPSIEKAYGER